MEGATIGSDANMLFIADLIIKTRNIAVSSASVPYHLSYMPYTILIKCLVLLITLFINSNYNEVSTNVIFCFRFFMPQGQSQDLGTLRSELSVSTDQDFMSLRFYAMYYSSASMFDYE